MSLLDRSSCWRSYQAVKDGKFLIELLLSIIKLLLLMGPVLHLKRDQTMLLFAIGKGKPLLEEKTAFGRVPPSRHSNFGLSW